MGLFNLFETKTFIKGAETIIERKIEYKDSVFYCTKIPRGMIGKSNYVEIPVEEVESIEVYTERLDTTVTDVQIVFYLKDGTTKPVSAITMLAVGKNPDEKTIRAAVNVARNANAKIKKILDN